MKTLKPVVTVSYLYSPTPLGKVLIAATNKGICYLGFDTSKTAGLNNLRATVPATAYVEQTTPLLKQALTAIKAQRSIKLKLNLRGTPFQLKVWRELLTIPRGHTITYGSLAKQIGYPKAYRAVGTAVGRNPISYFIPCHRVVPASGGIGHYHWGKRRKQLLLKAEADL